MHVFYSRSNELVLSTETFKTITDQIKTKPKRGNFFWEVGNNKYFLVNIVGI